MGDYLRTVAAKALGEAIVRPRVPSLFEPPAGSLSARLMSVPLKRAEEIIRPEIEPFQPPAVITQKREPEKQQEGRGSADAGPVPRPQAIRSIRDLPAASTAQSMPRMNPHESRQVTPAAEIADRRVPLPDPPALRRPPQGHDARVDSGPARPQKATEQPPPTMRRIFQPRPEKPDTPVHRREAPATVAPDRAPDPIRHAVPTPALTANHAAAVRTKEAQLDRAPDAGPSIEVVIGRVTVNAVMTPAAPARVAAAPPPPLLSLDQYLKQRGAGR